MAAHVTWSHDRHRAPEMQVRLDHVPETVFTVGALERGSQFVAVDGSGHEDDLFLEVAPFLDLDGTYRVTVLSHGYKTFNTIADAIEDLWPEWHGKRLAELAEAWVIAEDDKRWREQRGEVA